jgi:hypothetical protein
VLKIKAYVAFGFVSLAAVGCSQGSVNGGSTILGTGPCSEEVMTDERCAAAEDELDYETSNKCLEQKQVTAVDFKSFGVDFGRVLDPLELRGRSGGCNLPDRLNDCEMKNHVNENGTPSTVFDCTVGANPEPVDNLQLVDEPTSPLGEEPVSCAPNKDLGVNTRCRIAREELTRCYLYVEYKPRVKRYSSCSPSSSEAPPEL